MGEDAWVEYERALLAQIRGLKASDVLEVSSAGGRSVQTEFRPVFNGWIAMTGRIAQGFVEPRQAAEWVRQLAQSWVTGPSELIRPEPRPATGPAPTLVAHGSVSAADRAWLEFEAGLHRQLDKMGQTRELVALAGGGDVAVEVNPRLAEPYHAWIRDYASSDAPQAEAWFASRAVAVQQIGELLRTWSADPDQVHTLTRDKDPRRHHPTTSEPAVDAASPAGPGASPEWNAYAGELVEKLGGLRGDQVLDVVSEQGQGVRFTVAPDLPTPWLARVVSGLRPGGVIDSDPTQRSFATPEAAVARLSQQLRAWSDDPATLTTGIYPHPEVGGGLREDSGVIQSGRGVKVVGRVTKHSRPQDVPHTPSHDDSRKPSGPER